MSIRHLFYGVLWGGIILSTTTAHAQITCSAYFPKSVQKADKSYEHQVSYVDQNGASKTLSASIARCPDSATPAGLVQRYVTKNSKLVYGDMNARYNNVIMKMENLPDPDYIICDELCTGPQCGNLIKCAPLGCKDNTLCLVYDGENGTKSYLLPTRDNAGTEVVPEELPLCNNVADGNKIYTFEDGPYRAYIQPLSDYNANNGQNKVYCNSTNQAAPEIVFMTDWTVDGISNISIERKQGSGYYNNNIYWFPDYETSGALTVKASITDSNGAYGVQFPSPTGCDSNTKNCPYVYFNGQYIQTLDRISNTLFGGTYNADYSYQFPSLNNIPAELFPTPPTATAYDNLGNALNFEIKTLKENTFPQINFSETEPVALGSTLSFEVSKDNVDRFGNTTSEQSGTADIQYSFTNTANLCSTLNNGLSYNTFQTKGAGNYSLIVPADNPSAYLCLRVWDNVGHYNYRQIQLTTAPTCTGVSTWGNWTLGTTCNNGLLTDTRTCDVQCNKACGPDAEGNSTTTRTRPCVTVCPTPNAHAEYTNLDTNCDCQCSSGYHADPAGEKTCDQINCVADATCGNNIQEGSEICDGTATAGLSCTVPHAASATVVCQSCSSFTCDIQCAAGYTLENNQCVDLTAPTLTLSPASGIMEQLVTQVTARWSNTDGTDISQLEYYFNGHYDDTITVKLNKGDTTYNIPLTEANYVNEMVTVSVALYDAAGNHGNATVVYSLSQNKPVITSVTPVKLTTTGATSVILTGNNFDQKSTVWSKTGLGNWTLVDNPQWLSRSAQLTYTATNQPAQFKIKNANGSESNVVTLPYEKITTSLTISPTTLTLRPGQAQTISAQVVSGDKAVPQWTNSNATVCNLNTGNPLAVVVTALTDGNCQVTATVDGKTATTDVTVKKEQAMGQLYHLPAESIIYFKQITPGTYTDIANMGTTAAPLTHDGQTYVNVTGGTTTTQNLWGDGALPMAVDVFFVPTLSGNNAQVSFAVSFDGGTTWSDDIKPFTKATLPTNNSKNLRWKMTVTGETTVYSVRLHVGPVVPLLINDDQKSFFNGLKNYTYTTNGECYALGTAVKNGTDYLVLIDGDCGTNNILTDNVFSNGEQIADTPDNQAAIELLRKFLNPQL